MSSTKTDDKTTDFSKFYTNRVEKRIVDYLEALATLPQENTQQAIQAQVALVARSIENIAMMLAEQGYINNDGRFVRFIPKDLLTMQQALNMAIKMRSDILMQPIGLEAVTKTMENISKLSGSHVDKANPNTGLNAPPPLVPVDAKPDVVEEPISPIQDSPEPVYLPIKK